MRLSLVRDPVMAAQLGFVHPDHLALGVGHGNDLWFGIEVCLDSEDGLISGIVDDCGVERVARSPADIHGRAIL